MDGIGTGRPVITNRILGLRKAPWRKISFLVEGIVRLTDRDKQEQTGTIRDRHGQTGTDRNRQGSMGADRDRQKKSRDKTITKPTNKEQGKNRDKEGQLNREKT